MKERSILFQGSMVVALPDGTKTQTRRVAKLTDAGHVKETGGHRRWHPADSKATLACPYGQPSARLWVRETFFAWGRWETRFSAKKGRDEWHFVDMTLETDHAYCYAADGIEPAVMGQKRSGGVTPAWWKRPAIFMPRAASRITLEIIGVRVERLQDISDSDSLAEGVDQTNTSISGYARERYRRLWEQINGHGSWDVNPWVWCVEFKVVKP